MKRIALVLLVIAAMASPAMADQIKVTQGSYQTGSGGEFTFETVNPAGWIDLSHYAAFTASGNKFQTFCIEVGENISYGVTYNAALNTKAVNGGSGGPTPDPVSVGTGWLYSQFAMGNLAGYAFGGTAAQRQASAGALQNTIWWLEQEANDPGAGNVFRDALLVQFGDIATARLDGAANYGVYAVNMWQVNGGLAQDGLVFVPDGGATLMLLGGALMGLGALRRKFRG